MKTAETKTRRGNKNGGGGGGGGGKIVSNRAPDWQITRVGYHIKHPLTGKTMVWCDHHKSKDGVVKGMYMPAPHNHAEWLATKKSKREAYRNKVKAFKQAKRGSDKDEGGSPAKKQNSGGAPSKLALSKSLKAAFCTQLQVSEEDVDAIMEEAVADSLKE